ncbi:rho-related protein rac1C-like, partial [Convolutriloba macropyga]|uniref:rho-related protein rac1C-like n=1 Tax=Convolutriloba macropyga TaxID=536237 RepID=UPI003F51B29C
MNQEVVIVVVGDGVVGKSCLCSMFSGNSFPDAYIPTVMDVSHGSVMIDGHKLRVEVQDTAGSDDFDRIRQLQYPKAHAFVIVFGI